MAREQPLVKVELDCNYDSCLHLTSNQWVHQDLARFIDQANKDRRCYCFLCQDFTDHTTRHCPSLKCKKCKAAGHSTLDCTSQVDFVVNDESSKHLLPDESKSRGENLVEQGRTPSEPNQAFQTATISNEVSIKTSLDCQLPMSPSSVGDESGILKQPSDDYGGEKSRIRCRRQSSLFSPPSCGHETKQKEAQKPRLLGSPARTVHSFHDSSKLNPKNEPKDKQFDKQEKGKDASFPNKSKVTDIAAEMKPLPTTVDKPASDANGNNPTFQRLSNSQLKKQRADLLQDFRAFEAGITSKEHNHNVINDGKSEATKNQRPTTTVEHFENISEDSFSDGDDRFSNNQDDAEGSSTFETVTSCSSQEGSRSPELNHRIFNPSECQRSNHLKFGAMTSPQVEGGFVDFTVTSYENDDRHVNGLNLDPQTTRSEYQGEHGKNSKHLRLNAEHIPGKEGRFNDPRRDFQTTPLEYQRELNRNSKKLWPNVERLPEKEGRFNNVGRDLQATHYGYQQEFGNYPKQLIRSDVNILPKERQSDDLRFYLQRPGNSECRRENESNARPNVRAEEKSQVNDLRFQLQRTRYSEYNQEAPTTSNLRPLGPNVERERLPEEESRLNSLTAEDQEILGRQFKVNKPIVAPSSWSISHIGNDWGQPNVVYDEFQTKGKEQTETHEHEPSQEEKTEVYDPNNYRYQISTSGQSRKMKRTVIESSPKVDNVTPAKRAKLENGPCIVFVDMLVAIDHKGISLLQIGAKTSWNKGERKSNHPVIPTNEVACYMKKYQVSNFRRQLVINCRRHAVWGWTYQGEKCTEEVEALRQFLSDMEQIKWESGCSEMMLFVSNMMVQYSILVFLLRKHGLLNRFNRIFEKGTGFKWVAARLGLRQDSHSFTESGMKDLYRQLVGEERMESTDDCCSNAVNLSNLLYCAIEKQDKGLDVTKLFKSLKSFSPIFKPEKRGLKFNQTSIENSFQRLALVKK